MTPEQHSDHLITALKSLNLPKKEVDHRLKQINDAKPNNSSNTISRRYYNLAHEIKSLCYLQQFGSIAPSLDYLHTPGCDMILNDRYQIEFVCASPGDKTDKSGYDRFSILNMKGSMFGDYAEKERFIFSRITSALWEKQRFYISHLPQGTVCAAKPYLIFLGLGALSLDMFAGSYGIELTGVLFGKGAPTITIDGHGNVISRGYFHNHSFLKYTGSPIDCNLFCTEEFRCVSGIIFSDADLYDEYTTQNTWLFINPFADVKIHKKDFSGMIYWSADGNGDYTPRHKGRRV